MDGEVSYWRPGAEDWVPAQINTALGLGDSLYAADGANFELELWARGYVRGGSGTQLGIESLETGYLQLRVPGGHAAVDLRRIPDGEEIEIDTPNGAFLISEEGYYRFDVDEQETRLTVRRGGLVRVMSAGGSDEVEVASVQTVVVSGTETAQLQRVAPAPEDAWDRWNYDRTAGLAEEPRSVRYVSTEVAGVDDLDRYGDWRETSSYGAVWAPRAVAPDWSPYTTGRWVWDGYYGWTWVDDAPWGWAPYHYGRWCWVDGYWGWAPGPIVARPVYAPALVAFFGGGGVSVSIGIGTPFVSWVPLGWGEPVVPWWGPRGFVGRPYWGGWGGPRVVNNTVINNTTIINVNNIDSYANVPHRAAVGIDGERFGRGRFQHVRLDPDRVRSMRPVRGELGVRPVRESLVAREGRGQRPPDRIQNRRVVATRAPQDPSRLPRSRGLIRDEAARRPEPRIVAPRGGGGGVNRLERTGRRNEPPPIRGTERDAVERTRGAGERGPGDLRGRDAAGRERIDGVERNERGGTERIPGRERGEVTRGAPQPPGAERRGPAERDRSGREIGKSVERRGPDGGPPERGGTDEPTRRLRGADDTPAPPRAARERGSDRVEQPRGGDRNDRREAPERAMRQKKPEPPVRMDRPERQPRSETSRQRKEAPGAGAPPRSSDGGGRDRGGDRQRMEQPRVEQRGAPPRVEQRQPRQQPQPRRMEAPREQPQSRRPSAQREAAQRPERKEVPRQQRIEAPRPQRMEAPRQQRVEAPRPQRQEAPRMPRGGGDRHGRDK